MWYAAKNTSIHVGNNLIQRTPVVVAFDRKPILSIVINDQTGYIGVDCIIYDNNNTHIATVKHNQIYLVKGQKDNYKIDGNVDRFILLRRDTEEVLIDIKIRTEAEESQLNVEFSINLPNGFAVQATSEVLEVLPTHIALERCYVHDLYIALNVTPEGGTEVGIPYLK